MNNRHDFVFHDERLQQMAKTLDEEAIMRYGSQSWITQKPKDFRPLTLFLSYGHPESEICKQIYMALRARGHHPWFDTVKLRAGQDWRAEIAKGVADSEQVIACLSEHSTRTTDRDHSVCLDELAIAVGVRDGNIRTVLLGPEKAVNPPTTVAHIQWLDMSDWQAQMNQDEENFARWFKARMTELFQILESPENRDFVGQIETLKEALLPAYNTSRQAALLKKGIVGREWLACKVDAWMNDDSAKTICLLHGAPGVGKSAFSAYYSHYYAHERPRVAACLFCERGMPTYSDPKTVIRTLAWLLACRLPDYRQALLHKLPGELYAAAYLDAEARQKAIFSARERLAAFNEKELFDYLLASTLPGSTIDGGRQRMVILIDGLDECTAEEGNALARVLSSYICAPDSTWPNWLRVLVVARKDVQVTRWLPEAVADRIELAGDETDNMVDIRAYFTEHLKERFGQDPAWPRALDLLTQKSGGYFLYAELMVDALQKRGSLAGMEQYPTGLDGVFQHWFHETFPDVNEYEEKYRDVLGALIAAPAPLPEEELPRIFDWSNNDVHSFIRRVAVLLQRGTNEFGQPTLAFYHSFVSEWLTREELANENPYYTDLEDAVNRLANVFGSIYKNGAEALNYYEALCLPDLMRQNKAAYAALSADYSLFWKIVQGGDACLHKGKFTNAAAIYGKANMLCDTHGNAHDASKKLAVLFNRMGNIKQERGDTSKAIDLYKMSLRMAQQMFEESKTPGDRKDLAITLGKLAAVYKQSGDFAQALLYYKEMRKHLEYLVQNHKNPDDRRSICSCYGNIADIYLLQGKPEDALQMYETAKTYAEEAVRTYGTGDDKSNLAACYLSLGDVYKTKADYPQALMWYEKSRQIQEQLAKESDDLHVKSLLALIYRSMADIYKVLEKRQEATALYEKSMDLREIIAKETNRLDDIQNVSIACCHLADMKKEQGDNAAAEKLYRKCYEIDEMIVNRRGLPGDVSELAVTCQRLSDIYLQKGDTDTALQYCQKSKAMLAEAIKSAAQPLLLATLSSSCEQAGNLYKQAGDIPAALREYEERADLCERLVRERGLPSDQRALAFAQNGIGKIKADQGDPAGALAYFEKAHAVLSRRAKEQDTAGNLYDLSGNQRDIADAYRNLGRLQDALQAYQAGLEAIRRCLAKRDLPKDHAALALLYERIGTLYNAQKEPDRALTMHKQALQEWRQLEQSRDSAEDRDNVLLNTILIAGDYLLAGDKEKALAVYEECRQVLEERKNSGVSIENVRNLMLVYGRTGMIYLDQGCLEKALVQVERSIPLAQELVQRRGIPEDKRDLSISYWHIGNIYQRQGRYQQALEQYQKCRILREKVAQESPLERFKKDLASVKASIEEVWQVMAVDRQPTQTEPMLGHDDSAAKDSSNQQFEQPAANESGSTERRKWLCSELARQRDAEQQCGDGEAALKRRYSAMQHYEEAATAGALLCPLRNDIQDTYALMRLYKRLAGLYEELYNWEKLEDVCRKYIALAKPLLTDRADADEAEALQEMQERCKQACKELGKPIPQDI